MITNTTRRDFVKFLGRAGIYTYGLASIPLPELLSEPVKVHNRDLNLPFEPILPSINDELILAKGFKYSIIIKSGDLINKKSIFGHHNDFLAFFPIKGNPNDGLLWSNHESFTPSLVNDQNPGEKKNKEQVLREMKLVGGTVLRIKRNKDRKWEIIKNDPFNKRFTAQTRVPFNNGINIVDSKTAAGTLANCAGGITPWNTLLTCEENYDNFVGEVEYLSGEYKRTTKKTSFGWDEYFPYPPEHYGWVVEINPFTGRSSKLTNLGRFCHEGATVVKAKDGRCVVYMADDGLQTCLYKFISFRAGCLNKGELYVASMKDEKWISLDIKKQPILQNNFNSQLDVMINCRKAGKLLGGTPFDKPEDIEIDPVTKSMIISISAGINTDRYGSLLRIMEEDNDPLSLNFKYDTFLAGGPGTGFACPDNLAFDKKGNLWMTSDIAGTHLNNDAYKEYGNNGLYYIPATGEEAGKVFQIASAPVDAEFTGLHFSPDYKTLFVSVQHPGQRSTDLQNLTSHWPDGGSSIPKCAVIAIEGAMLEYLAT